MAEPLPQNQQIQAENESHDNKKKNETKLEEKSGSILHVVVVGFHHKKGCQVDFSYPPLIDGQPHGSHDVPDEWKHLPFLALPDGAHNYENDTIYFHLPGRGICTSTIYGVSCYRQIKTQDLISKDADVTRGTVQKSVVVLSKLPLYGLIQAKLELITHAYFCERDFSKTEILQEFYESLSSSIPSSLPDDSQVFLGLSLRDMVLIFKHKILVLFKLLLLERRVLFYTSPVNKLCSSLLATISLFPGMIERGLKDSACPKNYNPHISTIELKDYGIDTEEYLDVNMGHVPNYRKKDRPKISEETFKTNKDTNINGGETTDNNENSSKLIEKDSDRNGGGQSMDSVGRLPTKGTKDMSQEADLLEEIDQELFGDYFNSGKDNDKQWSNSSDTTGTDSLDRKSESLDRSIDISRDDDNLGARDTVGDLEGMSRSHLHKHTASIQSADSGIAASHRSSTLSSDSSRTYKDSFSSQTYQDGVTGMKMDRLSGADDFVVLPNVPPCEPMDVDDFGFPLAIFGKGSLCHPYMSLQQHDLLQDVNVRSFLIGATNALFKHHRHLMDVIVEVEEGKVNIFDAELRKQLSLSTADLRFADFLIKNVSDRSKDVYLDGTGWEGGDEWIRAQFKLYLLSLLSTCTAVGTFTLPEIGDFNDSFVQAWKTTHNFRMWTSKTHSGIDKVHTGHPFHGQISVSDMKIRLSSVMQTTDRGKKLNIALNRTGVAVMQTGKVVGEALTSAKSTVSSWLYGLANEWKEEEGQEKETK